MSLNKEWRGEGICQRLPEPYLVWFFSERDIPKTRSAQRLCFERCPVREDCLLYALEAKLDAGVFGGFTADDRKGISAKGYSRRKERTEKVRLEVETFFEDEV